LSRSLNSDNLVMTRAHGAVSDCTGVAPVIIQLQGLIMKAASLRINGGHQYGVLALRRLRVGDSRHKHAK
jgi:hypothetical protein